MRHSRCYNQLSHSFKGLDSYSYKLALIMQVELCINDFMSAEHQSGPSGPAQYSYGLFLV